MLDYWISFAASLDPNDGHGSESKSYRNAVLHILLFVCANAIGWLGLAWAQYTPHNQVGGFLGSL